MALIKTENFSSVDIKMKTSMSFTHHLLSQACHDEAKNDEKHNEVSNSQSVEFPNNTEFRYDFSEIKRNH